MKDKIHDLLVSIYGISVAVAILAGAVVAILFLVAFIINGEAATLISGFNAVVMDYSKKLACFAIWIGLIDFYLLKDHALTIDEEEEDDLKDELDLEHGNLQGASI